MTTETLNVERRETMPPCRELLPSEVAVLVGCVGCNAACAGVYVVTGDKLTRQQVAEDMLIGGELTGIPVTVRIGVSESRSSGAQADQQMCDPTTAQPCRNPENADYFLAALAL